jgi:hypothetical protein
MYHIIIILFIVNTQATIQLGRIQNVSWILNLSQINNAYINVSNITCDQCLCQMFAMNNLTASMACQQKSMTCQLLFWNATAQLETDETSVVYFQTIPNSLQMTINQQLTTNPQGKIKHKRAISTRMKILSFSFNCCYYETYCFFCGDHNDE